MKKVVFDVRTTHKTGIYRYANSLLQAIQPLVDPTSILIYVIYSKEQEKMWHINLLSKFQFIEVSDDYQFMRDSIWLRHWLRSNDIQLYYSVHYLVDHQCPIPFIYTIHDLIRLKHPDFSYTDESFSKKFGRAEFEHIIQTTQNLPIYPLEKTIRYSEKTCFFQFFWAINKYLAQRCKQIVTVSEAVKEDIIKYLAIPARKVSVIPGSFDPTIFYPRTENHPIFESFNLAGSYCLYVGLGHVHKRLPWLIHAFAQARKYSPSSARLVIVGGHTELYINAFDAIASYHLDASIQFTGAISDEALAHLYSRAAAVVVSSIDEGFCLPALEALACRAEVIVPNLSALRETVGPAGHYYEVNNQSQLTMYLISALNGKLSQKASFFQNRFSWHISAQNILRLIEEQTI